MFIDAAKCIESTIVLHRQTHGNMIFFSYLGCWKYLSTNQGGVKSAVVPAELASAPRLQYGHIHEKRLRSCICALKNDDGSPDKDLQLYIRQFRTFLSTGITAQLRHYKAYMTKIPQPQTSSRADMKVFRQRWLQAIPTNSQQGKWINHDEQGAILTSYCGGVSRLCPSLRLIISIKRELFAV